MIIWSGFGILIPVIAIAGMFVGIMLGTLVDQPVIGASIGMLIAATGNWAIWKAIYPKEPRVLIDQATGQRVVVNPRHSLFFIPAKAWTWIFAILAIPVLIVALMGMVYERKQASLPGYKEFTAANRTVGSGSEVAHGNTPQSRAAAENFSVAMKTVVAMSFSGEKGALEEDYLTYCQESPDSIVILCHVPSLRKFKATETKRGLSQMAWLVGCTTAATLNPEHDKKLVVALRGIVSYDSIQQGNPNDDQPVKMISGEEAQLYPFFAPAP